MYKQLVIVCDFTIDSSILNDFDYLITPNIELTSQYQCKINDEIVDFDYLIITNKISKRIMSEDGYIITNNNFETNIDNYFAIGNCIRSNKDINEQLKIIIEYLKEN